MTSHGARPTWAIRAGAESHGGRTLAPAQDVGTIGRIATADDPPGARVAPFGSR
jgi:predicted enzyme related to lactoylglutathione lyase